MRRWPQDDPWVGFPRQLTNHFSVTLAALTAGAGSWQDAMLLATLKFVAFLWLGVLAAGITLLALLCLGDLLTRAILQRLPGRR